MHGIIMIYVKYETKTNRRYFSNYFYRLTANSNYDA
jgi:hypothetical protein